MRLYKGKKRILKKINRRVFTDPRYCKLVGFALNLSPGDLFNGPGGYNVRFTEDDEVEVYWYKNHRNKILDEVEIVWKGGKITYLPDIDFPKTKEEIEKWILSWDCESGQQIIKDWNFDDLAETIKKLKNGEEVVNEDGTKRAAS